MLDADVEEQFVRDGSHGESDEVVNVEMEVLIEFSVRNVVVEEVVLVEERQRMAG